MRNRFQDPYSRSFHLTKPLVTPLACARSAPNAFAAEADVRNSVSTDSGGGVVKRTFLVAWVVLAFGVAFASAAAAAGERTVSVYGKAEREVVPDVVTWRIAVSAEDSTLQSAKRINDERFGAALKVASQIAGNRQDVEVGPVRMDRMYTRAEHAGAREFSHFLVSRVIKLTQRDFSRFEETINALINSAEVELRYVYTISNEREIRDELRLQALDAAKVKASAMVERLGETLGRVVEISEFPPADKNAHGIGLPAPPSIDRVSPEARKLSVSVYVTFGIE